MSFAQSELEPSDIRIIAGRAEGIDPRTVEKYLRGMNTNRRKRRLIEGALRELGWLHLVRRPGLARARS